MRIYRIESIEGQGPYRTYGWSKRYEIDLSRYDNDLRHPVPDEDGIYTYDGRYICGFNSIQQMINWFNGAFVSMHEQGLMIALYESDQVLKGDKQVMFIGKRIEHTSILEWMEVFKLE